MLSIKRLLSSCCHSLFFPMTASYTVPIHVPRFVFTQNDALCVFLPGMGTAEAGTEGTSFWSRFRRHLVLLAEEIDEWLSRNLTGVHLIHRSRCLTCCFLFATSKSPLMCWNSAVGNSHRNLFENFNINHIPPLTLLKIFSLNLWPGCWIVCSPPKVSSPAITIHPPVSSSPCSNPNKS